MNNLLKLTIPLLAMPLIANATEITNTQITSTGVKIAVDLDNNLNTGEKVKIDYGKGLKPMICKNKLCSITLQSTVLPKNTTTVNYNIGIYKNDVLINSSLKNGTVDFVISKASSSVNTSKGDIEIIKSGDRSFSYTKIANDGSQLLKTAELGAGEEDWACTKDNSTGLIWEIKIDDVSLRDKDNTYSWYNSDGTTNGGDSGTKNGGSCLDSECDTDGYVKAVNQKGMCGKKDWRVPTPQELSRLLFCSDGKYSADSSVTNALGCTNRGSVTKPTINTSYFPNTINDYYWTSIADGKNNVKVVDFGSGYVTWYYKSNRHYIRLVSGGQ